jgi:hypothetical protein
MCSTVTSKETTHLKIDLFACMTLGTRLRVTLTQIVLVVFKSQAATVRGSISKSIRF